MHPARVAAPLAVLAGLGAATTAVALRDPHVPGSWGGCPVALLGYDCPGCGGLRAVHDLVHGRLADAASTHLLLVLVAPAAVVLLGRWSLEAVRDGQRPPLGGSRHARPAAIGFLVLLTTFTVLRNLPAPWAAWLAA